MTGEERGFPEGGFVWFAGHWWVWGIGVFVDLRVVGGVLGWGFWGGMRRPL